MKILLMIIVVLLIPIFIFADEYQPNFILITKDMKTTLKVSTKANPVHDLIDDTDEATLRAYPEIIKKSNDSVYLKSLKGILIDGSKIKRIDESFFKLRYGDTLESISIQNANFDYQHLIKELIKYKIKLQHFGISLEYLDFFPKNIDLILGLKGIYIDFCDKIISIDKNILMKNDLELIIIKRSISKENIENIIKQNHLKDLRIYNSRNVTISDELTKNTNLTNLTISSCSLVGNYIENINKCKELVTLTLENCNLTDGNLNLSQLQKLIFLNLRDNNFSQIPEKILQLDSLETLQLSGNQIIKLPIELMLSLTKRTTTLKIEITNLDLTDETKKLLEDSNELLLEKGYQIRQYRIRRTIKSRK